MAQSAAQMRFEASPRPSGTGLRVSPTGLADPWRPARQPCGACSERSPGGPGRLPRWPCPLPSSPGEAKEVQPRGSPGRDPGQPYRGPWGLLSGGRVTFSGIENKPVTAISNRNAQQPARQLFGGQAPQYCGGRDVFSGNENKRLTAVSNRNTNERRNAATLSKSSTSKFLIATKLHVSEEKAKRE
jgi:hypothetical protein